MEKVVRSGLTLSSHASQRSGDGHQPVNLQVQSKNVFPHGLAKPWRFPLLGPHPAPGMGAGAPAPCPEAAGPPARLTLPLGAVARDLRLRKGVTNKDSSPLSPDPRTRV